jgi:hypothetical protein
MRRLYHGVRPAYLLASNRQGDRGLGQSYLGMNGWS